MQKKLQIMLFLISSSICCQEPSRMNDFAIQFPTATTTTSTPTTTTPIPSLTVALQDADGNNVATPFVFNTSSNFTTDIATFTVYIYPPSTNNTSDTSYYIVLILKALDGSIVQKEVFPKTFTTPLVLTDYSYSIVLSTCCVEIASATLLSDNFAPLIPQSKEQFFNTVVPFAQQFLIEQDGNGGITATAQAGGFQPTTVVTTTTTSASPLLAIASDISIIITDGTSPQTLTFSQVFNTTDIINGIVLVIYIFPPSTYPVSGSGSYVLIATVKTLDGLKFNKTILPISNSQIISFANTPSSIIVSYPTNTALLTSELINVDLTAAEFVGVSPFAVKFFIQQNTEDVVNVFML